MAQFRIITRLVFVCSLSGIGLSLVTQAAPVDKNDYSLVSKTLRSLELVLIKAKGKSFIMGSPETEVGREDDENEHVVRFSTDYYLGITPVTRGQFAAFVKDQSFKTEGETDQGWAVITKTHYKLSMDFSWKSPGFEQTDQDPVTCMSPKDARAFCEWLSRKDGREYRLPTEAEWEYACRAGTKTAYSFGDDPNKLGDYAWSGSNSGGSTHPVATKKPNGWGLYDMHGNVWEWCEPLDPQIVFNFRWKGATWYHKEPIMCRSAYRHLTTTYYMKNFHGFRIAASIH